MIFWKMTRSDTLDCGWTWIAGVHSHLGRQGSLCLPLCHLLGLWRHWGLQGLLLLPHDRREDRDMETGSKGYPGIRISHLFGRGLLLPGSTFSEWQILSASLTARAGVELVEVKLLVESDWTNFEPNTTGLSTGTATGLCDSPEETNPVIPSTSKDAERKN